MGWKIELSTIKKVISILLDELYMNSQWILYIYFMINGYKSDGYVVSVTLDHFFLFFKTLSLDFRDHSNEIMGWISIRFIV